MISEVIEAEKLKQIIPKIETIEAERAESSELLKDASMKQNQWDLMLRSSDIC
jgi:hypothetical protein